MQQSWKNWFYFFGISKVLQDLATKIGIAKLSWQKDSQQNSKGSSFNRADLLEMIYPVILFNKIFSNSFKLLISYFSEKIWWVFSTKPSWLKKSVANLVNSWQWEKNCSSHMNFGSSISTFLDFTYKYNKCDESTNLQLFDKFTSYES